MAKIKTISLEKELKLATYYGCGCCEHQKDCSSHGAEDVYIIFDKSQKWDDCGYFRTVFMKDDIVEGKATIINDIVYCATAESTLYDGISDFILLDGIHVIRKEDFHE